MKNIKINDFWLLKDGSIFQVTDLPSPKFNFYKGNMINSGGFFENYYCPEINLDKKTTREMAITLSSEMLMKKVSIFLKEKT